jgi:hypothetical protein|tara:strand:+ start:1163 stop:1654 length:492 start_codon:yes stop_codon:yes gene_type:complete
MKDKTIKILTLGLPSCGILAMVLYSLTSGGWIYILQSLSIYFLIGGASLVLGGLIGFLFGIPKINNSNLSSNKYKANTNLEQTSDWLSKVLIGVGLTQISEITKWIGDISRYVAKDMTAIGNESPFIASIIIYFLVCGFIIGYLATRIILPKVLVESERVEKE